MPPFSLLIKPVSSDCNLSCDYCFYRPVSQYYPETAKPRMTDRVLEQVIKSYMQTRQPVHTICWQGGEPTLAGLDFFKKAVEFQKQYGKPGARISNTIQTNATRISDEMADFFRQYHFLVGCSLDGPEKYHNAYRRTCTGKKTYKQVMKGIARLERNHVSFNILTLVNRMNKDSAREIYTFLRAKGFYYHQYIPCTEYTPREGKRQPYAITGEEWGNFLKELFDAWYPRDVARVSIRNFETVLSKKIDGTDSVCITGTDCCRYFVVEFNGDIYPCDFFVRPELKIGNIMSDGWPGMQGSRIYKAFGRKKSDFNHECRACNYLGLCGGDCLKNRMYLGNPPSNLSCLCTGIRDFFDHTSQRFDILGQQVLNRRQQQLDTKRYHNA